jgi:hypothetical protein
MNLANEYEKGVIDVDESNGDIYDGIRGHLDHGRCEKQSKMTFN